MAGFGNALAEEADDYYDYYYGDDVRYYQSRWSRIIMEQSSKSGTFGLKTKYRNELLFTEFYSHFGITEAEIY